MFSAEKCKYDGQIRKMLVYIGIKRDEIYNASSTSLKGNLGLLCIVVEKLKLLSLHTKCPLFNAFFMVRTNRKTS